ncbi:MAG TPA: hypothetical protein VIV40_12025 [Kofleriaceae bacterium]
MGAIDNFLKRWGFAKLDRYGLILTPEDRVISMRHAVLDDGLGGKIVGWLEGDLAAMELDQWGATKRATAKPIAAPASLHKLPAVARVVAPAAPASPAPNTTPVAHASTVASPARPLPGVATSAAPVAARKAVTAPTPIPTQAPAPAPVVAAAQEPGEDEWEWEIAMARARAAADEVEAARVDLLGASAVIASAAIPRRTNPGMAAVGGPKLPPPLPEPLPPWPETEPFNEAWSDKSDVKPKVMSVVEKKIAVARTPARGAQIQRKQFDTQSATVIVEPQRPTSVGAMRQESTTVGLVPQRPTMPMTADVPRTTVIPVPHLPAAADPRLVRPAPYTPMQPRGRAARGTGAPSGKLEETVRTLAAPPPAANDDHTSPYVQLPSEVKPSGFAHTKRVAAKQR